MMNNRLRAGRRKIDYLVIRAFWWILMMGILTMGCLLYVALRAPARESGLVVLLIVCIFGAIMYGGYRCIYLPYRETRKIIRLFGEGYILNGIFSLPIHFSEETDLALQKFQELVDTKNMIEGSRRHAQFLALQNQINPHFLYNTLEGIRSEAQIAGVKNIAEMTEALATFFRYTISNVEKLATLEEELGNVKNYYKIQEFRFGDRLRLTIDIDDENPEELLRQRMPKLSLQPILENAIFHGVEMKLGQGCLRIHAVKTDQRLIIKVSDNGVGIEENHLNTLNQKLMQNSVAHMKDDFNRQGGIALINVNSRIKLIFGEEFGVYVYSRVNAGTDVVMTLPVIDS